MRESGGGVTVSLRGEFDLFSLGELSETLGGVAALRSQTILDLSGVTFLDLQAAREIAVRSELYAHHLTLRNLSPQSRASVEAFGLRNWFAPPDGGCEEPVLSGAS